MQALRGIYYSILYIRGFRADTIITAAGAGQTDWSAGPQSTHCVAREGSSHALKCGIPAGLKQGSLQFMKVRHTQLGEGSPIPLPGQAGRGVSHTLARPGFTLCLCKYTVIRY